MGISDITGKVKTARPVVPQIYAYTTPEISSHDGWTKIGYTEQAVQERIKQQTHTANVKACLEWQGNAAWEDGSGNFRDTDFHAYLRKLDVAREPKTEWFNIEPAPAKYHFYDFRENHGIIDCASPAVEYRLRDEQACAVEQTLAYARCHERGEFLWNAKPRFGKTLAAYDLCRKLEARMVLIVTNRPAIANSWYDDYVKFVGLEAGYHFISDVDALRGKPFVKTREEYLACRRLDRQSPGGFIEFVSLQDLKGAIEFGGNYDKLTHVAKLNWDVLIIDEAHEGVDTLKTDVAFDHIIRKFTLHLSGTPFKAFANEKFFEDAIFNWTYADEQRSKRDWSNTELSNPYADLPQLNMFTYKMSDIVLDEVRHGINIDGDTVSYAFDLNEFFATNPNGYFLHNEDVDRFLDALTTQKKFPFSTPELRDELRHSFWMLNRVDSAKALAKKLKLHPVFKEYEVVLVAGDGRLDDDVARSAALDEVRKAISDYDKTITISVGRLTTGVTVPEWSAVLMLSNMKSPALYMQTAFRAQNPCLFSRKGEFKRKENAYVFDFDPARTLVVFEQFANDLCAETASGGGDIDTRKAHIRTLLNFFPVLGEDEAGEMVELDAESVLAIPRKIRSREVVRRGFMSDFLFQNISNIFHAPQEILDVIQSFEPCKAPKDLDIDEGTAEELALNVEGEVDVPEKQVIGMANDLFGNGIYDETQEGLEEVIESLRFEKVSSAEQDKQLEQLSKVFSKQIAAPMVDAAKQNYGKDMKPAQQKKVERTIKANVDIALNREIGAYKIDAKRIENERAKELEVAQTQEQADRINERYDAKQKQAQENLVDRLRDSKDGLVHSAGETIVREVETAKREEKKRSIEDGVRDHLRGFSRTIPSFLMAYGDEHTTLGNFDSIIPAEVFYEVTSITVEQFRFLRDGGDFANAETGELEHFAGNLFDPVVFNDSVKEFLRKRSELADYFDESHDEDIFDYIPPQKTNQIFTPRWVVAMMADELEKENPGCFDDPNATFADLYMKSGLYITEIVKRLFRSGEMKRAIPDDKERINHILTKQVYGMAPTRIIYLIATNYIFGFDEQLRTNADHFVCADAAAAAKEGTLPQLVEECFG